MNFWVSIENRTVDKKYDGRAVLIDWTNKEILNTWQPEIPHSNLGNGIRWFQRYGDNYYVVDRGCIWVLDLDLNVMKRVVPQEYYAGHYLIKYQGEFVFDTVQPANLFMGNTRIGLQPHMAVNTITINNGELYLFNHNLGRLIKYKPNFEIILTDERLKGSHDCQIFNNKIIVNCSEESKFLIYNLSSKKLQTEIDIPKTGQDGDCYKCGFLKGLCRLDTDRVLIGTTPAQIFQINVTTGQIEDNWFIAEEPSETVHGINPDMEGEVI